MKIQSDIKYLLDYYKTILWYNFLKYSRKNEYKIKIINFLEQLKKFNINIECWTEQNKKIIKNFFNDIKKIKNFDNYYLIYDRLYYRDFSLTKYNKLMPWLKL